MPSEQSAREGIGNVADGRIFTQPSGQPFRWPKELRLTAVDELVFVLPGAILVSGEAIEEAFDGSDDIDIKIEFAEDKSPARVYLRLRAGSWVKLKRACEAVVFSEDGKEKRIRLDCVS